MIEIKNHFDHDEESSNSRGYGNPKKFYIYIAAIVVIVTVISIGIVLSNKSSSSPTGVSSPAPVDTSSPGPVDTSSPSGVVTKETELLMLLPEDQQNCLADRSQGDQKRWLLSVAVLDCDTSGVDSLTYAIFENVKDLEDTYNSHGQYLLSVVEQSGSSISETIAFSDPCATHKNESGSWGSSDSSSGGGQFICVSVPKPQIVWTHSSTNVLGQASIENGTIEDLIKWWKDKAGPK